MRSARTTASRTVIGPALPCPASDRKSRFRRKLLPLAHTPKSGWGASPMFRVVILEHTGRMKPPSTMRLPVE